MQTDNLISALSGICGEPQVTFDDVSKDFFAQDVFEKGHEPDVIVAPQSVAEISDILRLARTANRPIYIRGGGMSYTNTFLPDRQGSIMLDMRNLNTIREINTDDLFVVVEAGCTWAILDAALEIDGYRAVFWGPFSGGKATIGGSMSQGTANNNSAKIGTSSSTTLSYEIVTGTGEILTTGADAQAHQSAFIQNYGADVTGLFNADAGALGVKTAVTLKIEPRPKSFGGISMAFESFENMHAAMQLVSAKSIASAIIGMDAETAAVRSGARGLVADLKKLWGIVSTAHNWVRGIGRGIKVVLAGRRVFERAQFTAHFLVEGGNDKLMVAKERYIRSLITEFGDEIPNAAISLMRTDNFPDLPVTRFDGYRMLPIHGIFPMSKLDEYASSYWDVIERYEQQFSEAGIVVADIFSAIGPNSILFEPVFYWPDSLTAYHRNMSPKALQEGWTEQEYNPAARDIIELISTEIIDLMFEHGATHLQIGKRYPFMRERDEMNSRLLRSIKKELDPDGIINPGALGLHLS